MKTTGLTQLDNKLASIVLLQQLAASLLQNQSHQVSFFIDAFKQLYEINRLNETRLINLRQPSYFNNLRNSLAF
jgi:hypothetical protein